VKCNLVLTAADALQIYSVIITVHCAIHEKGGSKLSATTLTNIDRFQKLMHLQLHAILRHLINCYIKQKWILHLTIPNYLISVCRCQDAIMQDQKTFA